MLQNFAFTTLSWSLFKTYSKVAAILYTQEALRPNVILSPWRFLFKCKQHALPWSFAFSEHDLSLDHYRTAPNVWIYKRIVTSGFKEVIFNSSSVYWAYDSRIHLSLWCDRVRLLLGLAYNNQSVNARVFRTNKHEHIPCGRIFFKVFLENACAKCMRNLRRTV